MRTLLVVACLLLTGTLGLVPVPVPDDPCGTPGLGPGLARLDTAALLAGAAAGEAVLQAAGKEYRVPVQPVVVAGDFTMQGEATRTWSDVIPIHYAGSNERTGVRALVVGTRDDLVVMFSSWHGVLAATRAAGIPSTAAGDCYLLGGGGGLHAANANVSMPAAGAPPLGSNLCVAQGTRQEVCLECPGVQADPPEACGHGADPCPDGVGVGSRTMVCGHPVEGCQACGKCLASDPSEVCGQPAPKCSFSPGIPEETCGVPVPKPGSCESRPCSDPCLAVPAGAPADDCAEDKCDRARLCCTNASSCCSLPLPFDVGVPVHLKCGGCRDPAFQAPAQADPCQEQDPCTTQTCVLHLHTYGDANFCTAYHDGFRWAYMMGVGMAVTQDVWTASGLNTTIAQNGDCGWWNPDTRTARTLWDNSATCAEADTNAGAFEQYILDHPSDFYDDAPDHLFFLYIYPTSVSGWCGGGGFCPGNKGHADMHLTSFSGYGTTTPDLSDYALVNRQPVDLAYSLAHETGHNIWGTHAPCPGGDPRNTDKPDFSQPVAQADSFRGSNTCTELEPDPLAGEVCYDIMGSRPAGLDDRRTIPRYSDGVHNEHPVLSNTYYMKCEIAWKVTGKKDYHTADGCARMHATTPALAALP